MGRKTLKGNQRRQAVDSLRGYLYQIWHSLYAWLELSDDEYLVLEGAEDFDRFTNSGATAVQVKASSHNITLQSKEVIAAINNFWKLRSDNPDGHIFYRFLTQSKIGTEKGHPFGKGISGLELWNRCRNDLSHVEKLRDYLLALKSLSEAVKSFLSISSPTSIRDTIITPLSWETGSRDASYVQKAIETKLELHGDKHGIRPSSASSVVNRLLRETLEAACRKDNRFLDRACFLRIFEEETTERIPRQELVAMQRAAQMSDPSLFIPEMSSASPIQAMPLARAVVPIIADNFFSRDALVNRLARQLKLSRLLILTGSTGMGKTTLAKLITRKDAANWHWIDLSNHDAIQIKYTFKLLSNLLDEKREAVNIVLDDLNLSPASSKDIEDYLGGLIYTLFERNGRVIITSKKSLPARLSRILTLDAQSLQKIPSFDEDEIALFAIQLGCPEDGVARKWAKLTLVQTQGHPQLVHAHLLYLADKNWPSITSDDLLTVPSDIKRERSEMRQLLDRLPEEQRELVYRLSIITGFFRRDHVIAIGENSPSINHSGDVFDKLVGPWIEHLSSEYYRISPLLQNSADDVWTKEKINLVHGIIAQSLFRCGKFSVLEATNIFYHAFWGRSEDVLALMIRGFLFSSEDTQKAITNNLSWFLYLGIPPAKNPLFENKFTNFLMRMFQFHIALEIDLPFASSIAELWDKETTPYEPHISFLYSRYILASKIILHFQVKVSAIKLLFYFSEMAEIQEKLKKLSHVFPSTNMQQWCIGPDGKFDYITALANFLVPRCSQKEFLDELLEGLKNIQDNVRNRILATFKNSETNARLLIDGVWLKEADREDASWLECVKVFEKALKYASSWNASLLAASAIRGITIIYDEYLNQPEIALEYLKKFEFPSGVTSIILGDAEATIHFRQKNYSKALLIWEDILPNWHPRPEEVELTPLFACRKSGISAACLGLWNKASQFFLDGYKRAKALKNKQFSAGLLADAGFAQWKSGDNNAMIKSFAGSLEILEQLPSPEENLSSYTVIKLVGHILMWIETIIRGETLPQEFVTPEPGLCSNPERNEKIRELPLGPFDFSWMHLAQIEYGLGTGRDIFEKVYTRLINSPYPVVRMFIAELDIKYAFRNIDFEKLPSKYVMLNTGYYASQLHQKLGGNVLDKSESDYPVTEITYSGALLSFDLFSAALFILGTKNQLDISIFGRWRDDVKHFPIKDELIDWINIAESMYSKSIFETLTVMKKNKDREKRILASLNVLFSENVKPDDLFYSQVTLMDVFNNGPWIKLVSDEMAALFAKQWLSIVQLPAILRTPRLTVPEIKKACESQATGAKKAAHIILAAASAVSVTLPQSIHAKLYDMTHR
jgi:hypothetical protein